MEKDKSIENNEVVDKNVVEFSELNAVDPVELVDKKKEIEDGTDDELVRSMKEELTGWETKAEVPVKMPRIKYHQEKEMGFNKWRSKVFDDSSSASMNCGSDMSNEGGVT
ncbi:hypothetical protein Tco_1038907 [Tanacetum coccineum]